MARVAHVSLYRKYRSQTFAEVVGQEHVTTTLANAVTSGRLHHAYLFTGPRGTGKTSTARILAKAVNCESGPTATPCNACTHCESITTGSSVDVIEIDAASHGGVDDVRDLRDRVAFAPASARMKVYIVDECHMLSPAGWNAFLKTVEEPPGHVVFVFATTEPHKVLPTILSRTQRFDFKRLNAANLVRHVEMIGEREGLEFEPGAIDLIVRAGDGSARDTLSVLDQVMAFTGTKITVGGVADVLGTVSDQVLAEIADRIATGDVPGLLIAVQRLADGGQDLRQLARDIVEHLRSLLLLQAAPDAGLVETTPERLAHLTAQAGRLGRVELVRAIELLADAQAQMRRGNTRLPLEIALVKSALPEASGDPAALAARLDRLERLPRAPVAMPVETPVETPAQTPGEAPVQTPAEAPPRETPVETPRETPAPKLETVRAEPVPVSDSQPATAGMGLDRVRQQWPSVLEAVKRRSVRLGAVLAAGAPVAVKGDELSVQFPYAFHAESCSSEQAHATLREVFEETFGEPLRLVAVVATTTVPSGGAGPVAAASPTDEVEAVLEAEAAEARGEVPDDRTAHAKALETLTRDLGATIVDGG
jgi:DNA polymerase-3 subunit gamma/tau